MAIKNTNSGFIFLEILIASALIGIVFMTLLWIGFSALNISTSIKATTQADALAKETIEALRVWRDGSTWATDGLGIVNTSGTAYYLSVDTTVNPATWKLNTGTQTIGTFTRSLVFNKVSRVPGTGAIESTYNASHDDPNTRKVTVTVAWPGHSVPIMLYLTNWQNH